MDVTITLNSENQKMQNNTDLYLIQRCWEHAFQLVTCLLAQLRGSRINAFFFNLLKPIFLQHIELQSESFFANMKFFLYIANYQSNYFQSIFQAAFDEDRLIDTTLIQQLRFTFGFSPYGPPIITT